MDPEGMICDEGVEGALKIMFNAMKQENHEMFSNMFRFFNSHKDELGYVANFSTKPLAGAAAAQSSESRCVRIGALCHTLWQRAPSALWHL